MVKTQDKLQINGSGSIKTIQIFFKDFDHECKTSKLKSLIHFSITPIFAGQILMVTSVVYKVKKKTKNTNTFCGNKSDVKKYIDNNKKINSRYQRRMKVPP